MGKCPSSNKMGFQTGLSIGGSGSFVWLMMRLVFEEGMARRG